jgi:hypothetical protein
MKTFRTAVFFVAIVAVANPNTASATEIFPGFDLFATALSPPDPQSFVDLTIQSGGLVGVVPLEGSPFGPANTDTIVERHTGSGFPFNVGDVTTIDIELVALSLRSVAPVDIGGSFFDMDVISGSFLGEPANPLGQMTVTHGDPNGGTFVTDFLPIDYRATFTEVGNPGNTFDIFGNIQFINTNGFWSHSPGPMDVHGLPLPAGGFHAGIDPIFGEKRRMDHVLPFEAHYTLAAMPEPSSGLLLGLGLVGLLTRRRHAKTR